MHILVEIIINKLKNFLRFFQCGQERPYITLACTIIVVLTNKPPFYHCSWGSVKCKMYCGDEKIKNPDFR